MTEAYPTDSALLDLTQEGETGVEYIETGKAPYYLEFRKLLQRLLLATRRANDLRVFDEGALSVGVKAGSFLGPTNGIVNYPGSSGNLLADNATNYFYLDATGTLILSTSGFPATTTEHVRLATIQTSSGDIATLTDERGVHYIKAFG